MVKYRRERIDRGIKARCSGIFALSSYREIFYLLLPRAIPIIFLLIFPFLEKVVGIYWEKVLVITCMIALLSLSWDLLASVGLVSLGQALFFGMGAYFVAFLHHNLGWPPFLTIPMASISGALFCTLLLMPIVRLRGIYFAMITLALPLLFSRIIEATGVLGGTEGFTGLSPLPNIWTERYIPIIGLILCLFGFRRLIDTDYGVVLQGIRDSDRTVMAGGINIYWYKIQVVFISALAGSFIGAFSSHYYQFVGMSAFAIDLSILPLTSAILGGVGTFAGATLGSFILVPMSEIFRAFGTLRVVFYCIILVIFIVGLPEGIFHYIQRKYHQFERVVTVEMKK